MSEMQRADGYGMGNSERARSPVDLLRVLQTICGKEERGEKVIEAKILLLDVFILIMAGFAKAAVEVYKKADYCKPGPHCRTCPFSPCTEEADEIQNEIRNTDNDRREADPGRRAS